MDLIISDHKSFEEKWHDWDLKNEAIYIIGEVEEQQVQGPMARRTERECVQGTDLVFSWFTRIPLVHADCELCSALPVTWLASRCILWWGWCLSHFWAFPLILSHPKSLSSPALISILSSFLKFIYFLSSFFHFAITFVEEDCVGEYIRVDFIWHSGTNKFITLGTFFLLSLQNYFL